MGDHLGQPWPKYAADPLYQNGLYHLDETGIIEPATQSFVPGVVQQSSHIQSPSDAKLKTPSSGGTKPKPTRKRPNRYANASPAVIERRRHQNRDSQRAYRKRKDDEIVKLRDEVERLQKALRIVESWCKQGGPHSHIDVRQLWASYNAVLRGSEVSHLLTPPSGDGSEHYCEELAEHPVNMNFPYMFDSDKGMPNTPMENSFTGNAPLNIYGGTIPTFNGTIQVFPGNPQNTFPF
ncbi:hypothetical protein F5Y08DRAFT_339118 [Xylaria arbuscula]|nr:hypothetical protein F5Y08DRAFT_339118 [Xylaria arbuscula]